MLAKQVHHRADASDVHEAGLIHDKLPGHFATRIKHPGGPKNALFIKNGVVWTIMKWWLKMGRQDVLCFFGWYA